eukprot:g6408.t1
MVGRELGIFDYHNESALNCCERTHFFPGAAVADVLLLPAFLKTELKSREADAQKSKRCGWRSFLPGLEAARKQWQRDINKQRNRKKKAAKKFKKSLDEEIEALWARQQLHDEKYFQLMDFRLPPDTDETDARGRPIAAMGVKSRAAEMDFDFQIQRMQKQLDEDLHEQHFHLPQQGLQQQPLLQQDGEAVAFLADHHVVQDDCQHEASEEGRSSSAADVDNLNPSVIAGPGCWTTGTSYSKTKGGKGYYGGSYYKSSSYGYGAYHQMKHSGKKSHWLDSISKGTGKGVGTNWINTKGKAGAGVAAAAATPTAVPPPAPPAPVDLEAVVKELHAIPGVAENLTNPTFASKTPSTTDHSEVFEQTPPEVAVAVSGAAIGNGSSCAADDVGRTLSFGETSEGAVLEEGPIREKKEPEPVQAEDRAGDEDMDKEKESESLQEIATQKAAAGPFVDPLHFYTRESQPMEDIMGVPFLGGTCAPDFGIGGVAAATSYSGYGYAKMLASDDAYNQGLTDPTKYGCLMNNWYEELIMRETTGVSRYIPQRHVRRSGLLKDFTKVTVRVH